MPSNIDATKPTAVHAFTADVRAQFLTAKNEITTLQTGAGFIAGAILICAGLSSGAASGLAFNTGAGAGFKQAEIGYVVNAVNFLQFGGGATTSPASIKAGGTDANVSLMLSSQGTGSIYFTTNSFAQTQVEVAHVASAVNYLSLRGGATGNAAQINSLGTDANVPLSFFSKGAGNIVIATGVGAQINMGGAANGSISFFGNSAAPVTQFRIRGDATDAVNFIDVFGQPTGTDPILRAEGETNVGLVIASKGNGNVRLMTGQGARTTLICVDTASSVNYCQIQGSTAGNPIGIKPAGTDANVILALSGKGASGVRLQSGDFVRTILEAEDVASSINFIRILPNIATGGPRLFAGGTDTNVWLQLGSKGTESLYLSTNSGVNQVIITHTASAVNTINMSGAATGDKPSIVAAGTDTNVGMIFQVKGTTIDASEFVFRNGAGTDMVQIDQDTGTIANSLILRSRLTGVPPVIIAVGTDTNVGLELAPKGTGRVILNADPTSALHAATKQYVDGLAGGFAAGTIMLFKQTSAPTGWTKDTTSALNDTCLRIVTGTVGSGGATAFTSVFGASKTTGAYTLATADIPAHTHTQQFTTSTGVIQGGSAIGDASTNSSGSTGGGGSHTHTLSLDLKYNDVIIASKN